MKKFKLPGLFGLYGNSALRNLGFSLIGIFVPLYILKLTGSLLAVLGFYLLLRTAEILFTLPAVFFITKFGPDWATFASNILTSMELAGLILAAKNLPFLVLVAILAGIKVPLYWLPYHLTFIKLGNFNRFGTEGGILGILAQLFSALGTILGGIVISFFGFRWVFLLVILVILVSSTPLFFDRFSKRGVMPKAGRTVRGIFKPTYQRTFLAFLGAGLGDTVVGILWPIFIFKVVRDYVILGGIVGSTLLISLLFLFGVGRYVDRKGMRPLRVGIFLNSLNWIIRGFLVTPWQIFWSNFCYEIGSILTWVPFDTWVYKKAAKSQTFEFLLKRELVLNFSRIFGLCLLGILLWGKVDWKVIFPYLGVIGFLLVGSIGKENGEKI